jgi:hypothetical protein
LVIRFLAVLVAWLAASAPAFADGLFCEPRVTFKRDYAADLEGGYYEVGEDREISARFRDRGFIAAEIRIIEPHRTKEWGTGVAFLFCDATSRKALRIAFSDNQASDRLSLRADLFEHEKDATALVPKTFLAVSKTDANRATFRKDEKGQIVIGVSGEVFTIDPGFDVRFVRVQIFCSKSRVRFLDGELVS